MRNRKDNYKSPVSYVITAIFKISGVCMYEFEFGFKSDKGRMRKINQDAFFAMPRERIFVVADGVGGHSAGEIASRTAVSELADAVRINPISLYDEDDLIREKFNSTISSVNKIIFNMAKEKAPKGMATTLVLIYIGEQSAYLMNVGDSRAYLIRDGSIMQMTEDHTYVNDLVKKGLITPEKALNHPDRNMITRAVGAEESVKPDFFKFDILKGDKILLCTDGLYNEVSSEMIRTTIDAADDMRSACDELVRTANMHGGSDNITALTIKLF